MTSTYDSAESIATLPPGSDLDDEQIRKMLASPLHLQDREACADRPRVYHSFRENSVSSSPQFRESARKPAAVFSHKRKSSHNQFKENFTSSDPEEAARSVLEEQRDHLLAEAKSEILKQECEVDLL